MAHVIRISCVIVLSSFVATTAVASPELRNYPNLDRYAEALIIHQQEIIKRNALDFLQTNYRGPMMPVTQSSIEWEIKWITINQNYPPGIGFPEANTISADWSKAKFNIVFRSKPSSFVSIKTIQNGPSLNPRPALGNRIYYQWNCATEPSKAHISIKSTVTSSKETQEEESRRLTETFKDSLKVELKLKGDVGTGGVQSENSSMKVVDQFVRREITNKMEFGKSVDVSTEISLAPLTVVEVSSGDTIITRKKTFSGNLVLDGELGAYLADVSDQKKYPVGLWSKYVEFEQRSVPFEGEASYDDTVVNTGSGKTINFANQDDCTKAKQKFDDTGALIFAQ